MTTWSNTKQDMFSSNHSSQSISNQSILLRNPDSARTHHSQLIFKHASKDDVVRDDMIDKVIKKEVSPIMSNQFGRV